MTPAVGQEDPLGIAGRMVLPCGRMAGAENQSQNHITSPHIGGSGMNGQGNCSERVGIHDMQVDDVRD